MGALREKAPILLLADRPRGPGTVHQTIPVLTHREGVTSLVVGPSKASHTNVLYGMGPYI